MSDRTEAATHSHNVVIGFGNILLQDEGVGVHVIQNLEGLLQKSGQEYLLIDGGTCPDVLFSLPEEISTLIVIDAVKGGGKPGTVYRFTPDDIEFKRTSITTLHQLGLREGLGMMKLLDKYPTRVIIFGVEPKEIGWGLKISPELEQVIHQVALLVKKEIVSQVALDGAWHQEERITTKRSQI